MKPLLFLSIDLFYSPNPSILGLAKLTIFFSNIHYNKCLIIKIRSPLGKGSAGCAVRFGRCCANIWVTWARASPRQVGCRQTSESPGRVAGHLESQDQGPASPTPLPGDRETQRTGSPRDWLGGKMSAHCGSHLQATVTVHTSCQFGPEKQVLERPRPG